MPLLARPSIWLLTSASLMNCVLSSLAKAFVIEVVRQVEPAGGERQPLAEELRPQPRLAQVQLVLADQPRRVAVQQRQRRNLGVGRRSAQADDVGEEDVFCARPAVKNRSADASAYALLFGVVVALASGRRTACRWRRRRRPPTLRFSASSSASSIFSLIVCRR